LHRSKLQILIIGKDEQYIRPGLSMILRLAATKRKANEVQQNGYRE